MDDGISSVLSGERRWCVVCADCIEVMNEMDGDYSVISDPPYGIGYEAGNLPGSLVFDPIHGDDREFDHSPVLGLDVPTILWGANNYAGSLPRGAWICWDKRCCEAADRCLGSPIELAWYSGKRFGIARIQHGGAVNDDGSGVPRVHPTQKPVRLMRWCIRHLRLEPGSVVFDPYCGSGTTGVACLQEGMRFIGVEIDEGYAEITRKRIANEDAQLKMFEGDG